MSRNRRRHPRVHAQGIAAHLRTPHGRTPCVVENISLGGLFVRTDQLEEVGVELTIDLVKPGWKRALMLEARVTSRVDSMPSASEKKPPGMGLQFVRVGDDPFERLRGLLRDLGAPEVEEAPAPPEALIKELQLAEEGAQQEPLDPAQFEARSAAERPATARAPDEIAKLMVQIKGLVMQLSEAQEQLHAREGEIERLRQELDIIRGALSRAADPK